MICNVVRELNTDVPEQGTLEVKVFFRDDEGNPVTPASLEYTLTDSDDNIVNNIDHLPLPLQSDLSVFLTGDDLQMSTIERSTGWAYRYLTLTGTYNEGTQSGLRISASCRFKVCAVRHGAGFRT